MDRSRSEYNGFLPGDTGFARSNSISRPSAKSVYHQRKQYAQAISSLQDGFEHRVEHLFTCELNNGEVKSVEDCITRLKMLDAQGRIWAQDLILQVKDDELLLADIETKEELECFPLGFVQNCCSILNSCSYNSILAITVKDHHHKENIFLFQCEEIGAELLQVNLEKILEQKKGALESQHNLRNNLENILSQYTQTRATSKPSGAPQDGWTAEDLTPTFPWSEERLRQEPPAKNKMEYDSISQQQNGYQLPSMESRSNVESQEQARNTEVLNHVLSDIEAFVGKVKQVIDSPSLSKRKKKKKQKASPIPEAKYVDTFQKMKYAFNLLGKLHHCMQEPSAPDLIHMLFSVLSFILTDHRQKEMAAAVICPLLTQAAINLLNSCTTAEERTIWKDLGDAWLVTRAEWPNGKDIPTYVPSFSDGWLPPVVQPPLQASEARHYQGEKTPRGDHPPFSARSTHQPQFMQVMYDFVGRNSKELTVLKEDIVEVLDKSKQWWMVRNRNHETGYVPNNILEPTANQSGNRINQNPDPSSAKVLHKRSRPEEVSAWLRDQGFSKLSVKSLGVLSGAQLLELSKRDIKFVCPEEGEQVFSLLSAMK
ncbi:epidermal growth factor receptor kinase substrate 8-like protein 3 isoform X2 [Microcaecilia unicolor]|nr:epidermal growth factor receptor kinase substrate 8-like protein 3 isoform X2 [Microcaecilia unicolor]XP_030076788.1 epidermal growth factor receptor kinase substrate 8-like protein 3 isoform X2 [Microcaecilia unicolor]XP_030076789.1 epidermal growth factor receptor kinase substrate 8-like protein 3 isoform X2 [Microcaecilia unicolor]XP_030076790.1 epidermal growth factor receptor kinase substrate 8-like protein 3 isoform X2 [Microcaecilia unicolor]XP_030076791.1 epidermal growth factor rece